MTAEPEQNAAEAPGTAGLNTAGLNTAGADTSDADAAESDTAGATTVGVNAPEAKVPGSGAATAPRAGVPVWRTGKPDAVLAAAVDVARAAVETIAAPEQIGRHLGARTEGDRLVTHLFESKLAGYGGWQWYAVLTRNSRSKVVTVDELGLLPSEDSILAPEWVPWAERVRPEDAQTEDAQTEESADPADAGQDTDEPDVADADAEDSDPADADAAGTGAADADAADADAADPGDGAADADAADAGDGRSDAGPEHDDEEADLDGFVQPVVPGEETD